MGWEGVRVQQQPPPLVSDSNKVETTFPDASSPTWPLPSICNPLLCLGLPDKGDVSAISATLAPQGLAHRRTGVTEE